MFHCYHLRFRQKERDGGEGGYFLSSLLSRSRMTSSNSLLNHTAHLIIHIIGPKTSPERIAFRETISPCQDQITLYIKLLQHNCINELCPYTVCLNNP